MAKKADATELQRLGKIAYEAKKYDDALDSFSKAIVLTRKWSPLDVLPILDLRVAAYVKLGNVELARKDATSMIRDNKSDSRGYLRCAQLERLQGNPSAALRWYEHGLKQVPKSDRLFNTIEAQFRKTKTLLEKQLSLSKSKDPVSVLPAELVELVMAHLEYVDVVKCLQVSKGWKLALSRSKPLIDTVDFSDAKRTINYKMMLAALKRLGPVPKTLIMKDLAGPATDLLRINLERWHNYTQLEELDISSFMFGSWASGLRLLPFSKYNLKSLTIKEGRLRGGMVVEIMRACASLETARFSNIYGALWKSQSSAAAVVFPSVRILELGGDKLVTYSVNIYPAFFSYFPNLEQVESHHLRILQRDELFDLSAHSGLRKLKLSSCKIDWWPKLPSNIEMWDNYDVETPLDINDQRPKLGELSKLRFLRFQKTSLPPLIESFLPSTPSRSITHLDTRGTSVSPREWNAFDLNAAIVDEHLLNLRELAIGGADEDLALIQALSHLRKLEVLSLTGSKITGSLLIDIIKNCRDCLRQITLIDCPDVSAETINWARDQGIVTHVRKSGG